MLAKKWATAEKRIDPALFAHLVSKIHLTFIWPYLTETVLDDAYLSGQHSRQLGDSISFHGAVIRK